MIMSQTTRMSRSKTPSSVLRFFTHFACSLSGTRRAASLLPHRRCTVTKMKSEFPDRNDAIQGARNQLNAETHLASVFFLRGGSASAASPVNRTTRLSNTYATLSLLPARSPQ